MGIEIRLLLSESVETVVLLSREKVDGYVEIDFDFTRLQEFLNTT